MSLTVGDLIDKLEKLPQDLPVVMSQDAEGNGFSPDINAEVDTEQVVVLWPSYFDELDEVVDNYIYEDEE